MNKKIVCILVLGLLIAATALPVAGTLNDNEIQEKVKSCSTTGADWYLQWSNTYGGWRSGGPFPIGDIDEDGINEVIIGGADGIVPGQTKILSYDEDTETYIEEHSWSCEGADTNAPSGYSLIDLDDDGNLEFCLAWRNSENDGVYAYDWDGTNLEILDIYNGTGVDWCFVTLPCDYDDDGDVELVFSNDPNSGPGDKHITALGWDNENDQFIEEAFFTFTGYENRECTITTGDTDNDGKIEIVATLTFSTVIDCGVWALNWNKNSEEWEEEEIKTDFTDSTPCGVDVGDINGNGIPEIAFGNWAGDTAAWVYEWSGDEYVELWNEEYPDEASVFYSASIGDPDNDGINELCIGTDQIHIYQWDGADYVEEATISEIVGNCVWVNIGDCDSDGFNELKTCDNPPGSSEYIFKCNNAPLAPEIDGPTEGKVGVEYSFNFSAIDVEGHDVQFNISWGDGHLEQWKGTFGSGEVATFTHTWDKKDKYIIKAQARDIHRTVGEWSEHEINIPRNRATTSSFFQSFLERFSDTFPILKLILNLVNNGD